MGEICENAKRNGGWANLPNQSQAKRSKDCRREKEGEKKSFEKEEWRWKAVKKSMPMSVAGLIPITKMGRNR